MNQYIITEDLMKEIASMLREARFYESRFYDKAEKFKDIVKSHPYNPQVEIETQCKRVSEKLIFDRCDGCCDKCIFCDNAGGCLADSYRNKRAIQAEREKVLEELWNVGYQYDEILRDYVIHHTLLFEKLKALRQEGKVDKK